MSSKRPLTNGEIVFVCVGTLVAFLVLRLVLKESDSPSPRSVVASAPSTPPMRALRTPGGTDIIIFQSRKAASDAMAIISAGGNAALWARYVACVVPSGTEAVRLDVSLSGYSEVAVNSGPRMGCQGWVPMEFVK